MFRNQHNQQEILQREREDFIRNKIKRIDLINGENGAESLKTIDTILGMLEEVDDSNVFDHFSRKFIDDMYYETKYKVDEHLKRDGGSFMAFSLEKRLSIGNINVQFGEIHLKFAEFWEQSRNNLSFS